MKPIPPRIIAHIFTKQNIPADELEKLRTRLSATCEEQGRTLVDIVVDQGAAKFDPAEHKSLRRIARGDADGVMLMQLPLTMSPDKSRDVLRSHLDGPLRFLTAADLAERGLLPGGTKYTPHRTTEDAAHLARMLRSAGLSFRTIASRLSAEGFRAPRGGRWFASTVAKLIEKIEQSAVSIDEEPSSSP